MQDYVGCFAVTAGLDIEGPLKRFEEAMDDYNIDVKSIGGPIGEALAEYLHLRMRRGSGVYQMNN